MVEGDLRIQQNNLEFKKIAVKSNVDYLDTYSKMKKDFSNRTSDGVHLNPQTQFLIACDIVNFLNSKTK